ncbi:MAG: CapA family protein [Clostridium sp.]|uniref:CapA family protein n=1 Tax=Clostridium sp. TaxID=1506 RepID=UPI003EE7CFB9
MRRKRKNNKRKMKLLCLSIGMVLLLGGSVMMVKKASDIAEKDSKVSVEKEDIKQSEEKKEIIKKEVIITAAGDCTLGTDTKFNYSTSFNSEVALAGDNYSTIMKNVKPIFEKDDYTIVNLETTFTDTKEKRNKGQGTVFHFKGSKDYVNVLTEGSIEGVTLANNHIYDYGQKGFDDTVQTLEEAGVDYCGEGYRITKEIKGIKFVFLGYQAWSNDKELKDKIKADIEDVKDEGASIVIPYFHWGIERDSKPYDVQVDLARYSIDMGADMVLGSHPHVIQSMEEYKGKMIVYSLGNFSFGGNSNPSDKRTFMVQTKFKFEDDKHTDTEYKVIPTMISSVQGRNDYRPTVAEGNNRENILNHLNSLSNLNGKINDKFFKIN